MLRELQYILGLDKNHLTHQVSPSRTAVAFDSGRIDESSAFVWGAPAGAARSWFAEHGLGLQPGHLVTRSMVNLQGAAVARIRMANGWKIIR